MILPTEMTSPTSRRNPSIERSSTMPRNGGAWPQESEIRTSTCAPRRADFRRSPALPRVNGLEGGSARSWGGGRSAAKNYVSRPDENPKCKHGSDSYKGRSSRLRIVKIEYLVHRCSGFPAQFPIINSLEQNGYYCLKSNIVCDFAFKCCMAKSSATKL
jgi:hypothetical protein